MDGHPTVAITDSDLASHADEDVLREAGITTVRFQATTENDVIAALSQVPADALVVQWAPVTAAVLDAAPRCRFISRLGIGIDMIDIAAATLRGVAVANTPDYCGPRREVVCRRGPPRRRPARGHGHRRGRARPHRVAGRGTGESTGLPGHWARSVRRAGRRHPAHLARGAAAQFRSGHAARPAYGGNLAPDPARHDGADAARSAAG